MKTSSRKFLKSPVKKNLDYDEYQEYLKYKLSAKTFSDSVEYHSDVGFPKNLQIPKQIPLKPSNHARQQFWSKYFQRLELPNVVDLSTVNLFELEEYPAKSGNIIKVVFRMPFDDENDISVVAFTDKMPGQEGFIKTVWLNHKKDVHKTLNKWKYYKGMRNFVSNIYDEGAVWISSEGKTYRYSRHDGIYWYNSQAMPMELVDKIKKIIKKEEAKEGSEDEIADNIDTKVIVECYTLIDYGWVRINIMADANIQAKNFDVIRKFEHIIIPFLKGMDKIFIDCDTGSVETTWDEVKETGLLEIAERVTASRKFAKVLTVGYIGLSLKDAETVASLGHLANLSPKIFLDDMNVVDYLKGIGYTNEQLIVPWNVRQGVNLFKERRFVDDAEAVLEVEVIGDCAVFGPYVLARDPKDCRITLVWHKGVELEPEAFVNYLKTNKMSSRKFADVYLTDDDVGKFNVVKKRCLEDKVCDKCKQVIPSGKELIAIQMPIGYENFRDIKWYHTECWFNHKDEIKEWLNEIALTFASRKFSQEVDVQTENYILLFHGTSSTYIENIKREGLKPPDVKKLYDEMMAIANKYSVKISKYVRQHLEDRLRIREHSRVHLITGRENAKGYASRMGRQGGEFIWEMAYYLGRKNKKVLEEILGKFRDAKPVVITVKYPVKKLDERHIGNIEWLIKEGYTNEVEPNVYEDNRGGSWEILMENVEPEYIVGYEEFEPEGPILGSGKVASRKFAYVDTGEFGELFLQKVADLIKEVFGNVVPTSLSVMDDAVVRQLKRKIDWTITNRNMIDGHMKEVLRAEHPDAEIDNDFYQLTIRPMGWGYAEVTEDNKSPVENILTEASISVPRDLSRLIPSEGGNLEFDFNMSFNGNATVEEVINRAGDVRKFIMHEVAHMIQHLYWRKKYPKGKRMKSIEEREDEPDARLKVYYNEPIEVGAYAITMIEYLKEHSANKDNWVQLMKESSWYKRWIKWMTPKSIHKLIREVYLKLFEPKDQPDVPAISPEEWKQGWEGDPAFASREFQTVEEEVDAFIREVRAMVKRGRMISLPQWIVDDFRKWAKRQFKNLKNIDGKSRAYPVIKEDLPNKFKRVRTPFDMTVTFSDETENDYGQSDFLYGGDVEIIINWRLLFDDHRIEYREDYEIFIDYIVEIFDHEFTHVMEEIIQHILERRKKRKPDTMFTEDTIPYFRQPDEFKPWIRSVFDIVKIKTKELGRPITKEEFLQMSTKPDELGGFDFMSDLYQNDRELWNKAVKDLYAELTDNNLMMASRKLGSANWTNWKLVDVFDTPEDAEKRKKEHEDFDRSWNMNEQNKNNLLPNREFAVRPVKDNKYGKYGLYMREEKGDIFATKKVAQLEIPDRYRDIVEKVRTVANEQGYQVYIVGGFVRDLMLGREPKDLDLMVEGEQGGINLAKAIAEKYGMHEPVTFPRFGTAQLTFGDELVEFVMPRKEYYTEDSRKPVTGLGTIEQDALRRDFGMNALFLNINDMKVLDLTGHGLSDIKNKVIQVTDQDNADVIFHQDPLRMLRAVRQALQLGFEITEDTKEAIKRNADRLKMISKERIKDEFSKILMTDTPSNGMRMLKELGLISYVIPEMTALEMPQDTEYHHKDIFEHTMMVLDRMPKDLISRLSALLHDIGKPTTKAIVDETVHFLEHEKVGEEMSREILKQLKFPNEIIDSVSFIVGQHMRPHFYNESWSDSAVRRFVRELGEYVERVMELADADVSSMNPDKVQKLKEQNEQLKERMKTVQVDKPVSEMKDLLDGYELMEMFDRPSGVWIGKIKNYLMEKQLENPNLTKDEAIGLAKEFVKTLPDEVFRKFEGEVK